MSENNQSKQRSQEDLAKLFVEQARDLTAYSESKSLDLDKQLDTYAREVGNTYAALDVLLYSNPALRAQYNSMPEQRANPSLQVSYDATATHAGDDQYFDGKRKFERAAPLDTASNPGGANIIQTSLADTILVKAEETGQVMALLGKDTIPYGDKEYPKITAKAVAAFIDENTTSYTDQSATTYELATHGLTKVKYTPRDFGLAMGYTNRLLKKVTPATIAFFRNYEAKGFARGIEQQALRGAGTGQDATGIVGVATSVTFATNAYITFCNALGVLAAADTENIQAVMHRKTWQEFKKLRIINPAYKDVIDPVSMKIDDIQVVLSNNNDASVATVGTVNLGDFSHYLLATGSGLDTIEDKYSGAANRKTTVYHTMQIDMGALIAASFATFTLTF